MKKRVILHYHGTDLRRMVRILGRESPFARIADKRYVSTPDLLPLAPGSVWLPSPLELDQFPYVGVEHKDPSEPIIILNAVASEAHGLKHKGLAVVREAIQMVKDAGYNIEFRGLVGTAHAEALRQYQQADIIIGQTHIGWYGKYEQECMAFGKPVITYINPQIKNPASLLGVVDQPVPVGHIEQDDPLSLVRSITYLIDHPEARDALGKAGRAYVETWHNANKIMAALKRDYSEVMGKS